MLEYKWKIRKKTPTAVIIHLSFFVFARIIWSYVKKKTQLKLALVVKEVFIER